MTFLRDHYNKENHILLDLYAFLDNGDCLSNLYSIDVWFMDVPLDVRFFFYIDRMCRALIWQRLWESGTYCQILPDVMAPLTAILTALLKKQDS